MTDANETNERINQLIQKAKEKLKTRENSESSKSYSLDNDSMVVKSRTTSNENVVIDTQQDKKTETIDFDTHVFNALFSKAT